MKTIILKTSFKLLAALFLFLISANQLKAACVANFTFSIGAGGAVTFTSTSVGTGTNTYYFWDFNGGSISGLNLAQVSHTYATNQVYNVTLYLSDSLTNCSSSITKTVVISNAGCNAVASFNSFQGPNGTVSFVSSLAPNYQHSWAFGDGGSSNQMNPSHTYTVNGIYNVTLTVTTPLALCSYTTVQSLSVTIAACSLNAAFTKTITNATVNFKSISSGTAISTYHLWDFGDLTGGFGTNPIHTYTSIGIYSVKLKISDTAFFACKDSAVSNVTITNVPCIASAGFVTTKDSTFLLTWNAYPAYPWNVFAVNWSWGDGSNSNLMYPSHTYSAPGTYSICLSVTMACGSNTTFCALSNIYRGSSAMVTINVINSSNPLALKNEAADAVSFNIYPNPNAGEFDIDLKGLEENKTVSISVYSVLGTEVYRINEISTNGALIKKLDLSTLPSGTYFIKADTGSGVSNAKLIICK